MKQTQGVWTLKAGTWVGSLYCGFIRLHHCLEGPGVDVQQIIAKEVDQCQLEGKMIRPRIEVTGVVEAHALGTGVSFKPSVQIRYKEKTPH